MPKRKFGISVEEELARKLDEVSEKLRVERSQLVERAIRDMLRDHSHSLFEHDCRALIVLSCPSEREVPAVGADNLRITQLHEHREGQCVQVFLVSGSSSKISTLLSSLSRHEGCELRYIVLH
ncbi:MAG: ribbon-helix-helix domain-containing protein [Acidilobaceae archaeon]|nr:ribbon-helix-helix domain-containing protein [Acidilobaceae archaeon]MCX8165376.1 ribbon-helix-helix domain-containing protein [Acidilobaceae archaeon]MDW7973803.1 ribbon-helix-helix domain-containing protein [Sulfolobales archaeon]